MKSSFSSRLSKFFFDALEDNRTSFLGKAIGDFVFLLILLNVAAAIVETLPSMQQYKEYFTWFEIFSLGIFLVEYILRVITAHHKKGYEQKWGRIGYILSPMMLFDAIVLFPAIVSFFFPFVFDARILRIIRVFRIIRINRYSKSLGRIIRIISAHKKDLFSAFLLIFIGVFILSTAMFYIEGDEQPEVFKSIPHSMYWGIITISTIGYGDVIPHTELGKLVTSIGALIGVAVYALPSALLGAAFYAEAQSKEASHVSHLEQQLAVMKKKLKKYEDPGYKESHPVSEKDAPKKIGFFQKIFYFWRGSK
jgi:voltage-gated potassium channel